MRRNLLLVAATAGMLCVPGAASSQRHSGSSSPPTAPPPRPASPVAPIVAASSGMGALQFVSVNYGVPAPQSLTRQLSADDDRTRAASLSAIGAPGQYLTHGHIPYPHSIQLDFAALGNNDDLDAIVTVELDQHLVSAVLMPEDGNWRRIGTVIFATPFSNVETNPATFVRTARSFTQPSRYRAVYRGVSTSSNGDYTENEAHLRIINGKAVVTMSFVSSSRQCEVATSGKNAHPGCDLVQRWLQVDAVDPTRRFTLISATGRYSVAESNNALAKARTFQIAHLRSFSCQPFVFSDTSMHYEPTAASTPCPAAAKMP